MREFINIIKMNAEFPKYIWDNNTGHLLIYESKQPFIHSSEYMDGPIVFRTIEKAKEFLKENNLPGNIGIKVY
tara:strand:- start:1006 stop:1224 length:219 start_codon:yes stop_codon:yes gene_type:complete